MNSKQDDVRAHLLDSITRLEGIDLTPDQVEGVRRYLLSRYVSESTALDVAAEALLSVGVVASVQVVDGKRSLSVGDSVLKALFEPYEQRQQVRVWPYLRRILTSEKRDMWYVAAYSLLSSLLGLAVPLSSQAIVNAVALGVFNRQLVVLCIVVLVALLILAGLSVLERYVVDLIQRRLFVRTAFDIAWRLPLLKRSVATSTYAPELVNRFFDVMTVQKSLGKFLLEGINAILVLTTGLVLLAIYHPVFIVYDVLFLLFVPVLIWVLGRGAVPTAVVMSKKKYETAAWLEDIARTFLGFKILGATGFAFDRLDEITGRYVTAKHAHFVIIARQILGSYIFKAFATVGILAVGGMLVIEQQMSLGQLVAAEIVIILIIGAIEKLILQFDGYYDMMAALDKLTAVVAQPIEESGHQQVPAIGPASVKLEHVRISFNRALLEDVSFTASPGKHISLVGKSGAGKSTILHLITGVLRQDSGSVLVNNVDTRTADLHSLRQRIGMVFPEDQLISATVRDNIILGRDIPDSDLRWALELLRMDADINNMPKGLYTPITGSGEELPFGLRRRILFARMIVHRPDLLLIDEAFEGIEDGTKLAIVADLFNYPGWTIINVSHDPEVIKRTDHVLVLADGRIIEQGSPMELAKGKSPQFCSLFPEAPDVF